MKSWLWWLLALLVVAGCGSARPKSATNGKIDIFVSVPPQAYFAKQLGGDRVVVHTLVPPEQDPHTYTVTPKEMAALSRAKVYFTVGVPVENSLLPKIQSSLPDLLVVDTRQGINLLPQSTGASGEELDPHIWMSPRLAIQQIATMKDTLVQLDPAGAFTYENNDALLVDALVALDTQLKTVLAPVKGKEFFVYHPAYGYFAQQYGLQQVAVESGGKTPSAKQLADLIALAKAHQVKVIFVQPEFSQQSAEALAEAIGGAVIPIDPLAENYVTNMQIIAQKLESTLGRQK